MCELDLYITREPEEKTWPMCPICGEETVFYIKNGSDEIIGCENCLKKVSSVTGVSYTL